MFGPCFKIMKFGKPCLFYLSPRKIMLSCFCILYYHLSEFVKIACRMGKAYQMDPLLFPLMAYSLHCTEKVKFVIPFICCLLNFPHSFPFFPSSSLQEYMHPLLKSEINVVRFPSNKKSPSRIQNRLFGGKC